MVRLGNGKGCDSRHPMDEQDALFKLFIYQYIQDNLGIRSRIT